jgi:hypothetical protein
MSTAAPSCGRKFFPQGSWAGVGVAATQRSLRRAFERWGLPERLRLDNGTPWGSWGDLPTELALWLVGLGLQPVFNPPRCPQKNGKVERSQGVSARWVEPPTAADAAQLQRRLDEADVIQREMYPVSGGLSRWQAHPDLTHSGRAYDEAVEPVLWELRRVQEHLVHYVVPRRIDSSGHVTVYHRGRYVGKRQAGAEVWVRYDAATGEWCCQDRRGAEVKRWSAAEIDAERIRALDVIEH